MAKYICKASDITNSRANCVIYVESSRQPCQVAKFLSENINNRINKINIPYLFEIPDFFKIDYCEIQSSKNMFRLKFIDCNAEREITITNSNYQYTNIDNGIVEYL